MDESARQHYIDSAFITDCLHVLIRLEATRKKLLLQKVARLKRAYGIWKLAIM